MLGLVRNLLKTFLKILVFPFRRKKKREGRGSFGITSITDRGETVRSKAEKTVADWLAQNKYEYELEHRLKFPSGDVLVNDFYLPAGDINIEYWGMTTKEYLKRKKTKKKLYKKHRLKLVSVEAEHLSELDEYLPEEIKKMKRKRIARWFPWPRMYQKTEDFIQKPEITPKESVSVEYGETNGFCTSCGSEGIINTFCTNCGEKI